MRSPVRPRLALLLWAGLAACHADPAVAPPPSDAYDVERYALAGAYDWERGRLVATLELTLKLDDGAPSTVTLDSEVAAVTGVRAADGGDLPYFVDVEARQLTIDTSALADRALTLTIDYEADPGESLHAMPPRVGDPVDVRALYTLSEPRDVPTWMPCRDRPDDRAYFSVDMRMAPGEAMIANGDLELDDKDGPERRMRYATAYTLPTYLMAFAIAQFDVTAGTHGALPISVWRRPGVGGDHAALLAELDRLLTIYEPRLGPFPFEKYALVLVPGMSGGMENASITFQVDSSSAQPTLRADVQLTAHELVHQWFGDLVTVATWDDVWIKEGLATMLSAEALRATEDLHGLDDGSLLLGDRVFVSKSAAIRDPALAPEDKYTTGPYDRAAWLLTQIRAVVGEPGFWDSLRTLLDAHREGVVGTEDVLAAFAPQLGPDATDRARRAVDAFDLPTLELAADPVAGVRVTLVDAGEILVAPIELEWRRADGTVEPLTLVPGETVTLARDDPGDLLVLDPRDVHPPLWLFLLDAASTDSYTADLAPLLLPLTPEALATFTALPGAHQSFALASAGLPPPVAPDGLAGFLAALDAEGARALAIEAACAVATFEPDPTVQDAWRDALTAALMAPTLAGFEEVRVFDACSELLPPRALFGDEYDDLAAGAELPTVSEPRVSLLARFDLDSPDAREVWGATVRGGHTLRVRGLAARAAYNTVARLAADDAAEREQWRAQILELLTTNETAEVLGSIIAAGTRLAGPTAADNADLLDALDVLLHAPATWPVHATALCAALKLTGDDADAWAAFAARLADAPLSRRARRALADITQCQ